MNCALLDEKRFVRAIFGDGGWRREVGGKQKIVSIRVVPVTGDGAYVPWFEIHYEGESAPRERVNARFVRIVEYAA